VQSLAERSRYHDWPNAMRLLYHFPYLESTGPAPRYSNTESGGIQGANFFKLYRAYTINMLILVSSTDNTVARAGKS
jgi:hypothetical protein